MNKLMVDIIGFGEKIDIRQLLEEAVARCPYRHDFTLEELAELVEQGVRGKYVPVDVLDRIEGRNLGAITGWVIKRGQSAYRLAQILDPDMRWARPLVELSYFPDTPICCKAERLKDRWLQEHELALLPLDGCTSDNCQCGYRTSSLRQAERDFPQRPIPEVLPARPKH